MMIYKAYDKQNPNRLDTTFRYIVVDCIEFVSFDEVSRYRGSVGVLRI